MCVPPVGTHSARGLLTAWCQQTAALDCAASARHTTRPCACAQVAQSAEQGTENPRVGGSIPPLGIFSAGLRDRSGPPQPTAAHESLHTAGQDRAPVFAGGFRSRLRQNAPPGQGGGVAILLSASVQLQGRSNPSGRVRDGPQSSTARSDNLPFRRPPSSTHLADQSAYFCRRTISALRLMPSRRAASDWFPPVGSGNSDELIPEILTT